MIRHIILLKLKPGADIDAITRETAALQDKIPGIINFKSGEVLFGREERSQGFNWGFTMDFDSREALEAYGPHPEHQKVLPLLKTAVGIEGDFGDRLLCFDYAV